MVSLALYHNGRLNDNSETDVFRTYSTFFNKFSFDAYIYFINYFSTHYYNHTIYYVLVVTKEHLKEPLKSL